VEPERIAVDDSQWKGAMDGWRAQCVITRGRHRREPEDDDERDNVAAHDVLILPRRRPCVDVQSSRHPPSIRRAPETDRTSQARTSYFPVQNTGD